MITTCMKKIIFLVSLLPFTLFSQNIFYDTIDRHADTIQQDKFILIKSLTQDLIRPAKNDLEKTRAIFYWLAKNIKYDTQGLNSGHWDGYGLRNLC